MHVHFPHQSWIRPGDLLFLSLPPPSKSLHRNLCRMDIIISHSNQALQALAAANENCFANFNDFSYCAHFRTGSMLLCPLLHDVHQEHTLPRSQCRLRVSDCLIDESLHFCTGGTTNRPCSLLLSIWSFFQISAYPWTANHWTSAKV